MSTVGAYPKLNIKRGSNVATTSQVTAGTSSAALVGTDTKRARVHVKNIHATAIIYVDSAATATTSTGYKLGPGESETFETTDALTVISDTASTPVCLFIEEQN